MREPRWLYVTSFAATAFFAAPSQIARAQDVSERLVTFGRMSRNAARDLTRTVSDTLATNGRRADNDLDRVRAAVSDLSRREGADASIAAVKERLVRGLDLPLLETLFSARPNSSLLCATDFGITLNQCDALVAAAMRQAAPTAYAPADDGGTLRRVVAARGVSQRDARDAVVALRSMMLSVPRSLSQDEYGRTLLNLLAECPGGLSERESQIRAWHVGPTEGLARCIVTAASQNSRDPMSTIVTTLRLPAAAARALVRWAIGPTAATPTPVAALSATPANPRNAAAYAGEGDTHLRAGRFAQAAFAYEAAIRADPSLGPAHAGLGAARLQIDDAAGASVAYEAAIRLLPPNADPRIAASLHAGLGQAFERAGDFARAQNAFGQALMFDPNHPDARAGRARLTRGSAPVPVQPVVVAPPPREVQMWTPESARIQARRAFEARRFAEAADHYARALGADPNHPGSHAGLAASRLAMGDANTAVAEYLIAVRMEPTNAGYHAALGRAFMTQGNRQAAHTAFDTALQLDPRNRAAAEGLAQLAPPPRQPPPQQFVAPPPQPQYAVAQPPPSQQYLAPQQPGPRPQQPVQQQPLAATPPGPGPVQPPGPLPPPVSPPPQQVVAPTAPAGPAETLSRDDVLRMMRPMQADVVACLRGRSGLIRVGVVVVGASGNVREASIASTEFATEITDVERECVLNTVRGLTFPHFTRETTSFQYPYQISAP